MASQSRTAVVAVGGNSLITDPRISRSPTSTGRPPSPLSIAEMVVAGWNVVVTHGSGPQVGFILRRSEIAIDEVPPVPMDYAAADLQGAIGYMFQRALRNEFRRRGVAPRRDRRDPGAGRPRRSRVRRSEADRLTDGRGDRAPAGGRAGLDRQGGLAAAGGARGALALPQSIVEIEEIDHLVKAELRGDRLRRRRHPGPIRTWAATSRGRGGDRQGPRLEHAGARADADLLLISTGVEKVAIGFGRPDQRWLERISRAEAEAWLAAGEFAEGSMAPKIRAIIAFSTGRAASA